MAEEAQQSTNVKALKDSAECHVGWCKARATLIRKEGRGLKGARYRPRLCAEHVPEWSREDFESVDGAAVAAAPKKRKEA